MKFYLFLFIYLQLCYLSYAQNNNEYEYQLKAPKKLQYKKVKNTDHVHTYSNEKHKDSSIHHLKNTFHDEIQDILWCSDKKSAISFSSEGYIYKTQDYGSNWVSIMFPLPSKDGEKESYSLFQVYEITQSISNRDIMFFRTNKDSYISEDCGTTISISSYNHQKIDDVIFSTADPKYLQAETQNTCTNATDNNCFPHKTLQFSEDVGKTYHFVDKYVASYMWIKNDTSSKDFDYTVYYIKLDEEHESKIKNLKQFHNEPARGAKIFFEFELFFDKLFLMNYRYYIAELL